MTDETRDPALLEALARLEAELAETSAALRALEARLVADQDPDR